MWKLFETAYSFYNNLRDFKQEKFKYKIKEVTHKNKRIKKWHEKYKIQEKKVNLVNKNDLVSCMQ